MFRGRVTIDFETKSHADLQKVGAWVYGEDPTTEIICLCYRMQLADGHRAEVRTWLPSEPPAPDLANAIQAGYLIEAHNYSFEKAIWDNIAVPRHGWSEIKPEQWRCSMAVARYLSLPPALDTLCRALGLPGKDPEGKRLITKYSKLYLATARPVIPADDLEKFIAYCRQDVLLEERISEYLGDLPEPELALFQLDQEVNMRGLQLDLEGIARASQIVDQRAGELTTKFQALTGLNPTQNTKVMQWLATQGLVVENLQADYLEKLLDEDDLPAGPARTALEIRLRVNKASTAKLDAMARQAGADGRARWQSTYHGAVTGRDTGSGFQPLNLVRNWEDVEPEQLVRDIQYGNAKWLDMLYGDATEAVSKAGRHWIVAKPGHRIMSADFVSIEAVILACLAGEQWLINDFGAGKKSYEVMADKIYGLPPGTVRKHTHPAQYLAGKRCDLAFGFGGNVGAWRKSDNSDLYTDEQIQDFCGIWRAEHPATMKFQRELEAAAISAVRYPGAGFGVPRIGFEMQDQWLTMILPNGKRLWYREPEIRVGMPPWHRPQLKPECGEGACMCEPRASLTYMAWKTGQWRRVHTYGGKLAENATQGTSREYLNPAVLNVRKRGYLVILKVYDEIVVEVPDDFGSRAAFENLVQFAPGREWAAGWPIRLESWEGQRYRK